VKVVFIAVSPPSSLSCEGLPYWTVWSIACADAVMVRVPRLSGDSGSAGPY
jgi:hypothetical protein